MERKSESDAEKRARVLETIDTLQKEKDCWRQIENHTRVLRARTEDLTEDQKEQNARETEQVLAACREQYAGLDRLISICVHSLEGEPG